MSGALVHELKNIKLFPPRKAQFFIFALISSSSGKLCSGRENVHKFHHLMRRELA